MILDVRTMYITMGVICFVVVAALVTIQIRRLRRDGAPQWALGWAFQGTFWVLVGLRGIVGDFLSIIVAQTCLAASYSLLYAAVRQFRGHLYNRGILLSPVAATFIFFWYFSVYTDNLLYRVIFISLLAFLQSGAIVRALLRHTPIKERLSYWLTGLAFLVTALFWLNRLLEALTLPYGQLSIFHATTFRNPGVLALLGAAVLSSIGFVLMIRERAEEARRVSEQRWATTLASIGDAVIATDVAGNITFMNAVAESLTGWALREAAAKPIGEVFNIVNEQTRREVENPITKVLREGMVVGLANHTILVRNDGTEVPIDDSGAPIRDGDGKTMGVVLVFRDITERKRAEETLRESEEKYRNLVKYAPAGIYEIDIQGTKFFSINDVMCNILGYSREELFLMRPADLLDQEGVSLFQERIRKQLAGETVPTTIEYRVRKKNGEWIDTAINTGVCAYLDGKPTRISVIGYDITERRRTEKALRESEARLRRFYESGLIGVIYWNMAGVIIDANDKFLEMVGYTREDLVAGKIDWVNMTPVEYRRLDECSMTELKTTGVNKVPFEKEFIRKDGTKVPIMIAGAMLDEARFNGVAFVLDITERKRVEEELRKSRDELELRVHERTEALQKAYETLKDEVAERGRAEEALHESEERYRTLFNAIDQGFCIVEVIFDENEKPIDYRFLEVNETFEKQTGLIDAQGKRMRELAPKHEEHWFEIYGRIALTGQPVRFVNRAEQLHRWYDVYAFRFGQPENRQVAILFDDITERRRAEDTLRRQAALLDLSPDAILARDMNGTITLWGHGAELLYGWTRAEALGQVSHVLLKTRFPEHLEQIVQQVRLTGQWSGELVQAGRDGGKVVVQSRWLVQRNADGSIAEILESNVNITEQKSVEAQLRQAQKMEALGTLSGGIAHDFNNILAAIIGFTELVADHVPKESREARHLKRVLESSLRGRDLVRQMLTFSRKTEQEKKPLRLSSIVRETVKLIRATIPATISIRVNTLSESEPILADATQMQQIIMNLCTNAAYAMREKGGILDIDLNGFRVSLSNGDPHGIKPGLYTRLTVRDTGVGMSPDIMEKIFDPFFTTKKFGEGTGLGLSVVHGIVKQHDGYITAESEPGKGSTFTIYFPEVSGEPETDAIGDDELPTGSERILFVDDEEALVEMGEDILAELGYEVTSRMNSREALTLLKEDPSRFDLVITDQTMPEMTGVELATEILAVRADMPIIMCTGFSYLVDADKAREAGINAFVMKPLTKREIAGVVRSILDKIS